MTTMTTTTTTTTTQNRIGELRASIGRAVKGKDDVIELALITLVARGHLLIEDVPGVGKTTLAQALAQSFHCTFQRIQFTSDMLPGDVIGVSVFHPARQEFEFKPGPIFANVVLADEINRTTPKTQSALLEVMNEGQVTVDGRTYPVPQPFLVVATQNPAEHHGTYPLPESQLDRFLMRLSMGYPARESEKEILRNGSRFTHGATNGPADGQSLVELQASDVLEMQDEAAQVRVDESLLDYAMDIVERTRRAEQLSLGVSPRGALMLRRAAQARAWILGRNYCLPDDFKQLLAPVLAHRVVVNSRHVFTQPSTHLSKHTSAQPFTHGFSGTKSDHAAEILAEIAASVPIPI
jgi:MoxR-like ATPase